ncbi:hypothetical protein GA0115254_110722, partial [Streptomyces sp. Ncost-T10-10d]
PGETVDNMLTSRAFGGLAKLLEALRAHDARIVETLAEQQAPSRYKPVSKDERGKGTGGSGEGSGGVSAPAKGRRRAAPPSVLPLRSKWVGRVQCGFARGHGGIGWRWLLSVICRFRSVGC